MMAGAVVATAVHNPLLVFPAVIASHFVIDVLPHFGVHEDAPAERNKHPLFRYVISIDILLTICLLLLLPSILRGAVSWWVLVTGMFLAWAPDLVWVREFFKILKTKTDHERRHWSTRLHQKIQWFEKPLGLVTEIVWFGAMAVLLGLLAA